MSFSPPREYSPLVEEMGLRRTCADYIFDDRLKLKRPQTAKFYRQTIDEMYAEVEGEAKPRAKL